MAKSKMETLIILTPWLTTFLLEAANVQQLYRMWTEKTAEGQSLWGWVCVFLALCLWSNFYRHHKLRGAFYATLLGVLMNSLVVASVIYWRYFV